MSEFVEDVKIVANIIKNTLEEFDMYLFVDSEKEEFVFANRDEYHDYLDNNSNNGKLARVDMKAINVRDR